MVETSMALAVRLAPEEGLAALRGARAAGYDLHSAFVFRPQDGPDMVRPTLCALGALILARGLAPTLEEERSSPYHWMRRVDLLGISRDYELGYGRGFHAMPPNYTTYTPEDARGVCPEYALGYFDGLRLRLGAIEQGIPIQQYPGHLGLVAALEPPPRTS
jgi:hypothetical protein